MHTQLNLGREGKSGIIDSLAQISSPGITFTKWPDMVVYSPVYQSPSNLQVTESH